MKTNNKIILVLYITGQTTRSENAVANLRHLCEHVLSSAYDLSIVDILENPTVAEQEKILATPTLVKKLPLPLRRIIGDLSDTEKVLGNLDLRH